MRHLMAISLGPVQSFIAAARRTRDLWFGSKILSDISQAAASAIQEQHGILIFPHEISGNIANIILFEIETADPAAVAKAAREAAGKRWRNVAERVLTNPGVSASIVKTRWESQIDDFLEFFAAWVLYPDDAGYKTQRRRVMRLLEGRKHMRLFQPSIETQMRIPKSSLDGARETVLKELRKGEIRPKSLRLNQGEELDAIGLTKRLGAGLQLYPSVARIAADGWLRGLLESRPEILKLLTAQCSGIGFLTRIAASQYQHFPFDGIVLYPDRHEDLIEEADDPEAARKLERLNIPELQKTAGIPSPYLAVLRADGDKMGALIADLSSAARHREFSRKLAGFSVNAGTLVEKHFGALVYAGGDDVLALLPVDQALACADALQRSFKECLRGIQATGPQPTLSVGIGIGHFMEPLEDLLGYAAEAEKDAKLPDRNGLAIHFHTRGGEPSRIRGRWDSEFPDRLEMFIALYTDGSFGEKAGYDLETCARRYDGLTGEAWLQEALPGEAAFVLSRKRGAALLPELEYLLRNATSAHELHKTARELIVARRFAGARREAAGKRLLA